MKKWILLFLLAISAQLYWGQIIKGSITNDASQRIPDVNIYLDGTKIGTTSAQDGSFQLQIPNQTKGTLVFQKENYETFVTEVSQHQNKMLKITLNKLNEIEEIVLIPYTAEAYRNYIQYFLSSFIGENQTDVKIKNPRSLKFSYDKKNRFLRVKAPKTLIIENKKLGYEIQYNLINYSVDFNSNILKFSGTSFFKESKKSRKLQLNRMNAYEGSLMHFFRSVYQAKTNEDGFVVSKVLKIKNPKYPTDEELEHLKTELKALKNSKVFNLSEDLLDISRRKNSESEFHLALVQRQIPEKDYTKISDSKIYLDFPDVLQVQYKKYFYEDRKKKFVKSEFPANLSSYLYPEDEVFEIYPDGNISNPDALLSQGDFSKNKIENMLPLDYELGD